jgi:hypothetical protein
MAEIKTTLTWDCRDDDICCFVELQAVSFGRQIQTLRRNVLPSVRLNVGAFLSNHTASYSRRNKIILAIRYGLSWSREWSPIRLRTQERQGKPSVPPPTPPPSGPYTVLLFFLRPLVDFQNVMHVLL